MTFIDFCSGIGGGGRLKSLFCENLMKENYA